MLVEFGRRDEALLHWEILRDSSADDFEAAYHLAEAGVSAGRPVGAAVETATPHATADFRSNLEKVFTAPVANREPDRSIRHISICGVSFCGSTLLDRVLAGLPGVRSIGESHWLTRTRFKGEVDTMSFSVPKPPGMVYCSVCGSSCPALTFEFRRDIAADHTDWYYKIAERLQTGILVSADKNPLKLVDNDPLLRLMALVVFKSPSQAWASQLAKLPAGQGAEFYSAECRKYAGSWARTYRTFISDFAPRDGIAFLHFDSFAQAPRETLEALCSAMGLPFAPGVLLQTVPGHAIGGNSKSMERLRNKNYGVEIIPLSAPDFPVEHQAILDADAELQEVFATMRDAAHKRSVSAAAGCVALSSGAVHRVA